MNTFDKETHTYRMDGVSVHSVTQVLTDLLPCWQASDWHLQRGTAVHACAALIANRKEFEHDPQIDGQVRACRLFFEHINPCVHFVEHTLFSARYGFAGTPDLIARMQGKPLPSLFDWKASFAKSLAYQLGGYAVLLEEAGIRINEGFGVRLNDDGTFQMSEKFDLRRYKTGFLNLLSAYRIRRECKQKEGIE